MLEEKNRGSNSPNQVLNQRIPRDKLKTMGGFSSFKYHYFEKNKTPPNNNLYTHQ